MAKQKDISIVYDRPVSSDIAIYLTLGRISTTFNTIILLSYQKTAIVENTRWTSVQSSGDGTTTTCCIHVYERFKTFSIIILHRAHMIYCAAILFRTVLFLPKNHRHHREKTVLLLLLLLYSVVVRGSRPAISRAAYYHYYYYIHIRT